MSQIKSGLLTKYRQPSGFWRVISLLLPMIAVILSIIYVFHLRPFGFVQLDLSFLYTLFALFLPVCFIWIPATKKSSKTGMPWYDVLLCIIGFGAPFYFSLHVTEIQWLGWSVEPTPEGFILGLLLWPVMIEAGRRAAGLPYSLFVLAFSLYPLVSGFAPGIFMSRNFPLSRVVGYHMFSEDSLMGIPAHVLGQLLLGYMVFATALQHAGCGNFFTQLAVRMVGKVRGGNAKVSIVSSGFFASISGQAAPNVFTTGAFTIPAMKRDGFSPETAGAVEAVASTGGTVTPPVMGAVAFVMAQFLGIPYSTIALAAIVPAFLYFVTLFLQIDAYSAKHKLVKPSTSLEGVPPVWRILLNNVHIIISFALLTYLLFFERLDSWAPWIATAVVLALTMLRKETRLNGKGWMALWEETGRMLGTLIGIVGPVGMIIGSFIITGVAFSLPYLLVDMAGGNVYLMLLFGAIACFILGMGMSPTAVYIFLAITLAPGIVAEGFDKLSVHLFILYNSALSHITPPVAISAFAASIVAGSDPMKTGFKAMRLGIVIFLVPFFFVLSPAMILQGPPLEIVQAVGTCILGFAFISAGLEGYMWWVGNINILTRILLFAAGLLIAFPATSTDIWGSVLAATVLGTYFLIRKLRVLRPKVPYAT